MNVKRVLTDPKAVLAAVAGGFAIGLFAKPVGAALYPFGSLYIAFLSMCLLPILITAIVIGIAGLLRDDNTRPLFRPMAGLYVVGLILPCVVGIATALLLAPGTGLGPEAEKSIGALIIESPAAARADGGILGFLAQIIPTNPFEALSANQVMSIVFLSVCLGLALGLIEGDSAKPALGFFKSIYDAFMQLFRWAILLLAPGLLMFISGVVAEIDAEVLLALTKFVITFYVGGVILLVAYMLLFWLAVRGPVVATLSKLSNPNVLAFMTNNPIVALPATLDTLEQDYGVDRRVPDLVIPFGIFANQHGAVFLLSFLTVFLAQIYVIDLGFQDYAVIAIGSIIAGATAVGGGAVLIPTVAPILGAVGIPTSLALVVLATTDNIIGPMRTTLTLQSNITLTVMTARRGQEMPAKPPLADDARPSEAA
ncbi:cation:dicarboxylase symporter family transporter [uncultured Thiohalocapsa sp.]|uniref:dicarboxylate/amino acid:cation symporter n=1 Tax=uncultured Thiohalocapsa sp. TaxID=768990 RepID=UPI0025F8A352|nr:cation:dicarboxylase symporter family transporter [uncultured Thiohalocapsa sp.]